ncbi:effector-associated constant component EACC1 [Phytohabitans kaempferiae]|uniref:Uncharacterized protein n=1 Tax=Phytohabitans kaempferiae TaxID=1620943 RepID=A0ABV6LYW0_9ACTN
MLTPLEVALVAHNERFADDDPRWLDQVADLVDGLRRGTDSVRYRRTPVPGTKGTVDQLILSLGSAGVFTAAIEIVRAWLARDKRRAIEMTVTGADGQQRTVRVTAENAGPESFAHILAVVSTTLRERQ